MGAPFSLIFVVLTGSPAAFVSLLPVVGVFVGALAAGSVFLVVPFLISGALQVGAGVALIRAWTQKRTVLRFGIEAPSQGPNLPGGPSEALTPGGAVAPLNGSLRLFTF